MCVYKSKDVFSIVKALRRCNGKSMYFGLRYLTFCQINDTIVLEKEMMVRI